MWKLNKKLTVLKWSNYYINDKGLFTYAGELSNDLSNDFTMLLQYKPFLVDIITFSTKVSLWALLFNVNVNKVWKTYTWHCEVICAGEPHCSEVVTRCRRVGVGEYTAHLTSERAADLCHRRHRSLQLSRSFIEWKRSAYPFTKSAKK